MSRSTLWLAVATCIALQACAQEERRTPRTRAEWTTLELVRTGEASGRLEITNRSGYHLHVLVEVETSGSAHSEPATPLVRRLAPWQEAVPVHVMRGISLEESWNIQPYVTRSPGDPAVEPSAEAYRLPFPCGVEAHVTQAADAILTHDIATERFAVDFDLPVGTPVVAMRAGRVVEAYDGSRENCSVNRPECNALTNLVVIQHEDRTIAEYLHLAHDSVTVRPGEAVGAGRSIARSGNSGFSTAPHLHVAVATADDEARPRSLKLQFDSSVGSAVTPRTGERYAPAGCDLP